MICEICTYYAGDSDDHVIKFICGHHPNCSEFKIDKKLFISEFKRQIDVSVSNALITNLPDVDNSIEDNGIKKELQSTKISKKLYQYLSSRYFPIVPNSYIYSWESDLLAVNKDSQYITEYEIKISRNDFKADFKKADKHQLIHDCYRYNFSSDIPNFLYYATPPGLLNKFEIPEYCGLIELGMGARIVKRAPLLHKTKIEQIMIDNLLKKLYNKYWGSK